MREWLKDNIVSSLSLGAIIAGAVWFGRSEGLWFTSVESRVTTEKTIKDIDPVKMYGEYIMDSIEEVETQKYRAKQKIKDSIQEERLKKIDSLIRLNVYLSDQTNKKVKD